MWRLGMLPLPCSEAKHVKERCRCCAGESHKGLKGDELHAFLDAHVDRAAGCVEEGAVGEGVDHGRTRMDHRRCGEGGDARLQKDRGKGLGCHRGACRRGGGGRSHQDAGERCEQKCRHVKEDEERRHIALQGRGLDDARNCAGTDEQNCHSDNLGEAKLTDVHRILCVPSDEDADEAACGESDQGINRDAGNRSQGKQDDDNKRSCDGLPEGRELFLLPALEVLLCDRIPGLFHGSFIFLV